MHIHNYIRKVLAAAKGPMTAREVRAELQRRWDMQILVSAVATFLKTMEKTSNVESAPLTRGSKTLRYGLKRRRRK